MFKLRISSKLLTSPYLYKLVSSISFVPSCYISKEYVNDSSNTGINAKGEQIITLSLLKKYSPPNSEFTIEADLLFGFRSNLDVFILKNQISPMAIFGFLEESIKLFDNCSVEEKDILLSSIYPRITQYLIKKFHYMDSLQLPLERLILEFSLNIYQKMNLRTINPYSRLSLPVFWLQFNELTSANLPSPSDINTNNLDCLFKLYQMSNNSFLFFELVDKEAVFNNCLLLECILESSLQEELIDTSQTPTLLKYLKSISENEDTNQSDFVRIGLFELKVQKALSSIFKGFIPLVPWMLRRLEKISPAFKGSADLNIESDRESLERTINIVKCLSFKSYSLSTETSKHLRGLSLYYFLTFSTSKHLTRLLFDESFCINLISSMIFFHDWTTLELYLGKLFSCDSNHTWTNQFIQFELKTLQSKLKCMSTFVKECLPSYLSLREAISSKIISKIEDPVTIRSTEGEVEKLIILIKETLQFEEEPSLLDFRSNSSKIFSLLNENQKWILYNVIYTDPLLDFIRKEFFGQISES